MWFTADTADVYGRFLVRVNELEQSLRIIEQACDKLDKLDGAPVMVADKKIAWPAQLAVGADGMGNSLKPYSRNHGFIYGIFDSSL